MIRILFILGVCLLSCTNSNAISQTEYTPDGNFKLLNHYMIQCFDGEQLQTQVTTIYNRTLDHKEKIKIIDICIFDKGAPLQPFLSKYGLKAQFKRAQAPYTAIFVFQSNDIKDNLIFFGD